MQYREYELDEKTVTVQDTPEMHKRVFDRLMAWYLKMDCFEGEVIAQNDECQTEAGFFLAELADEELKFKVEYK